MERFDCVSYKILTDAFLFVTGDENRSPSRDKKFRKRTSVILPAEVTLPTPGLEYTPLSDEQSDQLIDSLTKSFYRHVSRYVNSQTS